MDTSKKYILMCEKAEEIQKLWTKDPTDFVFDGKLSGIAIDLTHDIKFMPFIWLPYQDQSQEMLFPNNWIPRECMVIMRKFQYFYEENCDAFVSFEQLWLAFVMNEKYNKTWDGKEWVKKG